MPNNQQECPRCGGSDFWDGYCNNCEYEISVPPRELRILVKPPNREPYTKTVVYDYRDTANLQEIIGGYMEVVNILPDIFVVVADDGKLKGYEPNLAVIGRDIDILVGTIFFVGIAVDEEIDFISLTDSQIEFLQLFCSCTQLANTELDWARGIVSKQVRTPLKIREIKLGSKLKQGGNSICTQ